MADHTAVINAWLLQMHFAMYRAGAVKLTRAPRAVLAGEHLKFFDEGKPDELRTFTDAAEAEKFIMRAVEEGDVVGIAWPPDEQHVFARLGSYGHLLASSTTLDAWIMGPAGAARVHVQRDNMKLAAELLGTAALFGLHVILDQEVRE